MHSTPSSLRTLMRTVAISTIGLSACGFDIVGPGGTSRPFIDVWLGVASADSFGCSPFSSDPICLDGGESVGLVVQTRPHTRQELSSCQIGEWTTSDPDVLTVASTGRISAVSEGSASVSVLVDCFLLGQHNPTLDVRVESGP